jgi:hypothetical protein
MTSVPSTDSSKLYATDYAFDGNWLPGISFGNNDEILNNDSNMDERMVTPPPQQNTCRSASCGEIGSSELLATCPRHEGRQQAANDGDNKSSRHLQFACHKLLETSHAPPIIPELTEDIVQSLWWNNHELLQMKQYSRKIMTASPHAGIDKDEWLGLDRFSPDRIAHKKKAIRFVLLAQHQQRIHTISESPEKYIRAVSRKCSHWSRNMSHVIGQRLFEELYYGNGVNRLATIPEEASTGTIPEEASTGEETITSCAPSAVTNPSNEENEENESKKDTTSPDDTMISNRANTKRKRFQRSASSMECEGRRVLPRRAKYEASN